MFEKIDHIGIAVRNLDESVKFYSEIFNIKPIKIEELKENKVKVAIFNIKDVKVELLEPLTDDSPIKTFIDKRGEGIHHIAYSDINIESKLKTLKEKGIILIDEKPRKGSHNSKIAFLSPKSFFGVLIELVEE